MGDSLSARTLSAGGGELYPCQGPGLNDPEACPHKAQLQWRGIGNKALLCTDCRVEHHRRDMRARYRKNNPGAGTRARIRAERTRCMIALFREGKRPNEIAQLMGITRQAVSKQLKKARVLG